MEDGGGGLTKNQESILTARRGEIFTSGENGWKVPMGIVGVMSLIGFVLGCVATDMARNNTDAIAAINNKPMKHNQCGFGDITFGETLLAGSGSGGSMYQIVGTNGAAMTWMEAYQDARSRCYNGHPGYLAIVGTQEENDFIHNALEAEPTYVAGDDAWIGATDTGVEGTFTWMGPGRMSTGELVFWADDAAVDGSFTNWADGEPNDGGSSGTAEDCVAMYGGGDGKWFDRNCYFTEPFFVVEFGVPSASAEEVWAEEHKNDDAKGELDDDYVDPEDEERKKV